jgi:hypothetical protein
MSGMLVTYTGRVLPADPLAIQSVDISINDLEAHLGRIVRWNGATRAPISVARHSVAVARILREMCQGPGVQLAGLLHDGHESYLNDVISPIKQQLQADYCAWAAHLDRQILTALGLAELLPFLDGPQVVCADRAALYQEAHSLRDPARTALLNDLAARWGYRPLAFAGCYRNQPSWGVVYAQLRREYGRRRTEHDE